jgi:hypothetical protein
MCIEVPDSIRRSRDPNALVNLEDSMRPPPSTQAPPQETSQVNIRAAIHARDAARSGRLDDGCNPNHEREELSLLSKKEVPAYTNSYVHVYVATKFHDGLVWSPEVGARLRALRLAVCLSVEALASRARVSPRAVRRLERPPQGWKAGPRPTTVAAVVGALIGGGSSLLEPLAYLLDGSLATPR